MKKSTENENRLVIFLCWAAYTAAYLGRLNLNAYIEPIRDQLGATKTELGLVSSFFFFSYGIGQLVHGILSRKYNTRYSVAIALVGSAVVNVTMAFCANVELMKYIWLLNGVFQSVLWSSVIKTLSEYMRDDMLSKAVVVISTPPALGTFLAYGLSATFSSFSIKYKWIFILPAIILILIGVVWFLILGKLKDKKAFINNLNKKESNKKMSLTPIFIISFVFLVIAAISNGFIKDGVTTWTPSILKESYGVKESLSILATVALPLIAILGAFISTALHKKMKNTSALNGFLYLTEIVILSLVLFTARSSVFKNPVVLLVLFGISAMLMSAVNNVITSIIPLYMREKMDSGLLAGVLDTFCYVGSTLSTAHLGFIADNSGWAGVFNCLLIFGFAACLVCWLSVAVEKRNINQQNN